MKYGNAAQKLLGPAVSNSQLNDCLRHACRAKCCIFLCFSGSWRRHISFKNEFKNLEIFNFARNFKYQICSTIRETDWVSYDYLKLIWNSSDASDFTIPPQTESSCVVPSIRHCSAVQLRAINIKVQNLDHNSYGTKNCRRVQNPHKKSLKFNSPYDDF